ncbi:cell wall alpha-1,3-glucan synthase mok13 [Bisporella sp. PMI_857]|nr:cell wall alpha-1,3-glucan synthase mok13 [Bisporella sp. PMI_857]
MFWFTHHILFYFAVINALPYDSEQEPWNLNTNTGATHPLEYDGLWTNHEFQPSPTNWRFPFYTIFLDRFANGDPSNDNANGTAYEHDLISNQFRNGGDVKGLLDSLDYLQGMGIKGLYLAGSPFINQPWAADSYSPLDLTLLDHHFGNITQWREVITEIHARGMYVVLDNTMSTLGDLVGFENYLNVSTPFSYTEHNAIWKSDRRYHDFHISDEFLTTCAYPRFWTETGERVGRNVTDQLAGCRDSELDQYGDVASFGVYPEWQKQLSKFGFVQDRLREWRPSVLDKIKLFSCITIKMLDIDGFRIDKALTITVDAQADWSEYIRKCAKDVGKSNFFIPGEIVSGNTLAGIYLGRGKEPQMAFRSVDQALTATIETNEQLYIRNATKGALDAAAFHYSIYRSLCRFLGIDGVYQAEFDTPINWVDGWENIMATNDMINQNTGLFDPRHMYGVTNQDVFRWPAIKNGIEKNLIGLFITTLILPGVPTLMWGEEQATYVLENTAGNYMFGRSPMTSSLAWQTHGCYSVGSEKYTNFPLDAALYGCLDDNVSLDHRDPSHPVRNVLKRMYEIRTIYPALNDGFLLHRLSNKTYDILLPGSEGTPTETGIWSVLRSRADIQDFTGQGQGNQSVWLVYGNENRTVTYNFNCTNSSDAMIAPFDTGSIVKNLFHPYEEYTLVPSTQFLGFENSTKANGCLTQITMPSWGFKALVPKEKWIAPAPSITTFLPGHDYRMVSTVKKGESETIVIQIKFSQQMDCDSVTKSIKIESNTEDSSVPKIDENTISCVTNSIADASRLSGGLESAWTFSANLVGVANGIHSIVVRNATNSGKNSSTGSVDRFLFRIGQNDNPMIFPRQSNYSESLLSKTEDGSLKISHKAAGATKFRYSLDFRSSFSEWLPYTGGETVLGKKNWTGTATQAWEGEHVYVQYWSSLASSSDHFQHGDIGNSGIPRRIAHLFLQGPYNQYSYDAGIPGAMKQAPNGTWYYDFMTEWPTSFQFNEWGMNPDGQPDQTMILGDINHDFILDRLPPSSLIINNINITEGPPKPFTAWKVMMNDADFTYQLIPVGSRTAQLLLVILLTLIPLITAAITIWLFIKSFYGVKFNQIGVGKRAAIIPLAVRRKFRKRPMMSEKSLVPLTAFSTPRNSDPSIQNAVDPLQADLGGSRRSVLIATMEYEIEDWAIKIKIGGLGVMSSLMAKCLNHQDIIWVVPCVQEVDYPIDTPVDSMFITILGKTYEVQVQLHTLRNLTYVLLDAPIFRKQSKTEPYPARMDDLESAIYYSAWNQCIAQAITRFDVSLYHINDYHGACAPLYLLPRVIPCALSLHNAEFQGLWPMRTPQERDEVCNVFNLDPAISQKYVQFGEVFNLLHAGASYLRIHQKGFGAVGVSKKYGKRSFARYAIFWGLKEIGSLPNPDPTDTAEWTRDAKDETEVQIDLDFEAKRPELKRQAQEWAGLVQDPDAQLFVFVGRWSMQKGIDLIADVFPSVLESYPKVQLITVGPVIDLYGRFAALKLSKMMELYPGRVYSKPEFTALPPYIFSGSEFALIPSRDEPFGLVAVEFGRKGALGVGARVGGLGQMPGWWYTVESMTPKHLVHQFKSAIHDALASSEKTRSMMRARSAKQRFPVAQWVEDLDTLQSTSIKISEEENYEKPESFIARGLKSSSVTNLRTLFAGGANSSQVSLATPTIRHVAGNSHLAPTTPSTPWSPMPSSEYHWTPNTPRPLTPSPVNSPQPDDFLIPPPRVGVDSESIFNRRFSTLSYDSVAAGRDDFALQKVDPSFTDATGVYLKAFEKKLETLDPKSSGLCIEENLMKSEKNFFKDYRDAKMGHSIAGSRPSSPRPNSPNGESFFQHSPQGSIDTMSNEDLLNEFTLGRDYQPPTGLKRLLLYRIGDWPIYSILLAFGQIIAANSYQITLLIGEIGETALQLYVIATIYAVSTMMWWLLFRRFKSVYCLSVPFVFYGLAFFLIGMAPFAASFPRGWIQNVATGIYAVASSSGSFFFALNFGDEGGAPIKDWVLRACIVQGTQQIYISALWYWGSALVKLSSSGSAVASTTVPNHIITSITLPIAVLMWTVGLMLLLGLPNYYHQAPGTVPSFYKSIFRRKIIIWFFIAVVIQNYWLSAPYGRNWRYLWTTQHAPAWAIALLVVAFFIVIWAIILFILSKLSKAHSWILPVFAIGLGAPRWCQMLWGTSSAGQYIPWAGSALASALLGRCLWLWLGVLDALQGVGFGMILLQTMTRFHITFTLVAAQVLGSIATILARLTAPDNTGPGHVFPNLAISTQGLGYWAFWLGLGFQIVICIGFAAFFRKEQLSKP